MLKPGDINNSCLEALNSMEEGVRYELTPDALEYVNTIRKEHGYNSIKPFSFTKDNNRLIFDWEENGWENSVIRIDKEDFTLAFALAFPLAFAFAFTFAFAEGRFQKVSSSCDGKVVEIEGIKYKLVKVKD